LLASTLRRCCDDAWSWVRSSDLADPYQSDLRTRSVEMLRLLLL
jgi:hypothetical protein